jgi:hypothetical protein
MRRLSGLVLALLAPSVTFAQGSITGVVRDSSGTVLPSVTVEASSDALIEKVRTAVSDGQPPIPHRRPEGRHVHRYVQPVRLQHLPQKRCRIVTATARG